jgi:hypothetical protein
MVHLKQQQEPEDSPSPVKTAKKITLFQPKHVKPIRMSEIASRK